jgi:hypothetical protein
MPDSLAEHDDAREIDRFRFGGQIHRRLHVLRLPHALVAASFTREFGGSGHDGMFPGTCKRNNPAKQELSAGLMIGAFHRSGIESAKEPLARMYEGATSVLATYLRAEFTTASLSRCRSTAFALVCLAMSRYQLGGLGVATGRIKSLRASAQVLIEALEA